MKPDTRTPAHRIAQRTELPPPTWPAPLDALPPLGATEPELLDIDQDSGFKESLDGLQVRELIGERLFERLFGPR